MSEYVIREGDQYISGVWYTEGEVPDGSSWTKKQSLALRWRGYELDRCARVAKKFGGKVVRLRAKKAVQPQVVYVQQSDYVANPAAVLNQAMSAAGKLIIILNNDGEPIGILARP